MNKTLNNILHFFKEFPAWVILVILFIALLVKFQPSDPRFIERITDAVLVALFTALSVRSRPAETKNETTLISGNSVELPIEKPNAENENSV